MSTFGSDECSELSHHEKRVLTSIERGLAVSDPEFARRMAEGADVSERARPRPAADHGVVLSSILLVLLIVALMPPSWQSVLGLVLVFVVLPASLLWTRAQHHTP